MLSGKVVESAVRHALDEYPKESVGVVTTGKYLHLANISLHPTEEFLTRVGSYPEPVEAFIHSHPSGDEEPSKIDMESQVATAVPWGIVPVYAPDDSRPIRAGEIVWFGAQVPPVPLLGRDFLYGVRDCFTLVRDYYCLEHNMVNPPEFPRDIDWWEKGEEMFTRKNIEPHGFREVYAPELVEGDIVFMRVGAKVTNHCGIYIENSLLLHHLHNRLSRKEPFGPWMRYARSYWRWLK